MIAESRSAVAGPWRQPQNVFKANPGKGLVKRTFKDKLTIGSGADQINLYYFGPAHTGGDAFVEFPAHRIMHVGDAFPNKGLPIMDKINGGSGVQYAATVRKAVEGRDEHRHHHQRPHAGADDAGRHARVRGLRAGLRGDGASRQEGGQDGRPGRKGVDDAREVQGFQRRTGDRARTAYAQFIFAETK